MLNITHIVERIEEIRRNHQLSAAGFASRIGVQRSAMSHILSGRNKPSLEFLMKVYEAFDEVALDWLIIGTSTPTPPKENVDLFKSLDDEPNEPQTTSLENPIAQKIDFQKQASIPTEESASPREIIYLYSDGSFERFLPKK
ncbi:MAG: helix-turn-helix transcriptional regulator [Flavobacteriaceae bacterium]|jgi:transcriptional regulator with XRE-family HTH domain|nr:helix-turn-helix transcriptional regulator [Flavobacteriaceae bacterium]MBT6127893.1 helix-turn-helix transcriptional regulator [Flavobacteriaceae bacterium]MDG1028669.1 helix-turn-helix transcriptional regulator [Flavobacteriaceae bacterium]